MAAGRPLTAATFGRARAARFFSNVTVDRESGCWRYGRLNHKGYGLFNCRSAHRWTYAWFVADIPAGLEIDHLCQNPSCVNPAHLEAVTPQEHNRRSKSRRTHCKYGHLRETYWVAKFNACAECHRVRSAKFYKSHQPKREPKTHCAKGHPRAIYWNGECRECRRLRNKRWYQKKTLTGIAPRDFAQQEVA